MNTVMEKIHTFPENPDPSSSTEGFYVEGEFYHIVPFNMRNEINFTSLVGDCSKRLYPFLFLLGKMGFLRKRLEDWIEVSPVHAQYYQITIQQKQQLEAQIKQGLSGIATAVADFELLYHDLRKYKDFVEYFSMIEKGKETGNKELVKKGEQSLKAVFIDMVDVHTGEGVALKLIAPRWPTIIADFMELEDDDTDQKKIAAKFKISEAEGVVLATKNKLYQQWRQLFRETVVSRWQHLLGLVKARKKSIDEYKRMLRPYIARYKSFREFGETPEGRTMMDQNLSLKLGAQALSFDISTVWAWRHFSSAPELHKASTEAETGSKSVRAINFPPQFKARIDKEWHEIKEADLTKVPLPISGIEPLDKWVVALMHHMENYYQVKLSAADILKARSNFINDCKLYNWVGLYFLCLELETSRIILRFPDGRELEDLTLSRLFPYFDSQNAMLLRYIEMYAKEKSLENYISDLIGELKIGEGAKMQELLAMYDEVVGPKPAAAVEKPELLKSVKFVGPEKITKKSDFPMFFRKGPYENVFDDRVTGVWLPEIGETFYDPIVKFWKAKFNVPGFVTGYS